MLQMKLKSKESGNFLQYYYYSLSLSCTVIDYGLILCRLLHDFTQL